MRSVANLTLIFFAVLFWIFRVAVVFCGTIDVDFPVTSFNPAVEIPILFISVICLVLIVKRHFIGALALFLMYAVFFGMEIANTVAVMNDIPLEADMLNIIEVQDSDEVTATKTVNSSNGILGIVTGVLGIMIALINMIYIIVTSNKKTVKATKKTDWFYQNEKFDRELDERADKNNYRIN